MDIVVINTIALIDFFRQQRKKEQLQAKEKS